MNAQRLRVDPESSRSAVHLLERHVTSFLNGRRSYHDKLARNFSRLHTPIAASYAKDAAALAELQSLAADEKARLLETIKRPQRRPQREYFISAHSGINVDVPPYDVAWKSSLLAGKTDANAGTFECSAIDTMGYEAVALGLYVSSPVTAELRFSADVMFHSVWLDWPIEPGAAAWSEGGVGVLVYSGNNVVSDQRAPLWSNFQSSLAPMSDEEWTFLTQTNAGQTYFQAQADATYLVWVWAWTATGCTGTALATGHIDANMPFAVVERM
jgi:hypothetical protein